MFSLNSAIKPIISVIVLLTAAGCYSIGSGKYTKADVPRPDQRYWPDELEVVDVVVRCVRTAEYTSSHIHAVREYAIFLRKTYAKCSGGGIDEDAGIRALNYIMKIHKDAKGGWKLWREAMKLACYEAEDEDMRMPGLPPPLMK